MASDIHPLPVDTILRAISFVREMRNIGQFEIADDILFRLESRLLSDKLLANGKIIVDEGQSQWSH